MQRTHWPTWKNFLVKRGLLSSACSLLTFNYSLIPIAAQMLFLGMPLFKSAAFGDYFGDLLDLLVNEDELRNFNDYLLLDGTEQEAGQ